ncbi:MAG: hypothetical protein ACXW5U_24770 [Thermoanaerobaculia bacterium]
MILAALVLAATLDVQPFVEKNTTILAVERGDLNRDGREDVVLVLEPEDREQPRPLLVLVRESNGVLKVAKRSAKSVLCRNCGGVMGDPFQGVVIENGRFTLEHYGGSSWRWSANYTFAWSRRDQSWQLVRVESTSFHAGDPDKVEKTVHTPPRDFGLIDVTEFDP